MSRARIVHNNKSSRHSVFFLFCGESVDFSFISRFDVAGEQLTQSFRTLGGGVPTERRKETMHRLVTSGPAPLQPTQGNELVVPFTVRSNFFFLPCMLVSRFQNTVVVFSFFVLRSGCFFFLMSLFYVKESFTDFFVVVVFLLICDGCQCHTRSHEVTQRRYGRRVERKKTASVALNCFLLSSSSSSLSGNYTVVDCQITAGLMC